MLHLDFSGVLFPGQLLSTNDNKINIKIYTDATDVEVTS